MLQSPTEPLTKAGPAPVGANRELDRVAWNLPRNPPEMIYHGARGDALDWDRFKDLYYPDTRRHDLDAIVAYGAYKRSTFAGSQPANDPISTEALSLEEWEAEGGTAR